MAVVVQLVWLLLVTTVYQLLVDIGDVAGQEGNDKALDRDLGHITLNLFQMHDVGKRNLLISTVGLLLIAAVVVQ